MRSGFGMASAGINAPRNGVARRHVKSGTSRGATQQPGRWKSVEMERVYGKVCTISHLEMKETLKDLEVEPAAVNQGEFGLSRGQHA